MKIVVSIPAYNEEKSLGKVIKEIKRVMVNEKYNYEILVVDDGSKDNTASVSKDLGAVVYSHPKNYGLAETFRTEMDQALKLNADIIVHIDADGQYLPSDIPKLINGLNKGYDLVLGSRFMGKIEKMSIIKKIGNIAFSKAISQITSVKITDGQTGFRAFTKDVAKRINIISNHTYTQEQIIQAVRKKFRILQVPIYFAKRDGKSRLIKNAFEYAIKAWINIIRLYRDNEPLKFFGIVGGLLFTIGIIIGSYLTFLHFTEGIKGHFGLMMLNILILSIGLQIIIFGFIADMLKTKH